MAIDTYGGLKQAIALWLNRNDMDTAVMGTTPTKSIIDTLIELAERKIYREFRGPANEEMAEFKYTSLSGLTPTDNPLVFTSNLIEVPPDMLELKSFFINNYPLTYMDPFTFGRRYANINYQPLDNVMLCPHFTREKSFFKVAGNIQITVDKADTPTTFTHIPIVRHYYRDFSGMNDSTDTNPVLQTNSDLYLFGALSEAEAYLVNDARVALWAAKYEEAMAKARDYNHQIDYHAGPLIMGGG
jgi:hypothetical protein